MLAAIKTQQSGETQASFGRLLYHAFFARVKGESELVQFSETRIRPPLRSDEPPEAPELDKLHASLLLLNVFANACEHADRIGHFRCRGASFGAASSGGARSSGDDFRSNEKRSKHDREPPQATRTRAGPRTSWPSRGSASASCP